MSELSTKFTVIPGRRRIAIDSNCFTAEQLGPQTMLFPEARSGIVVFVCFPDVEEREFVSLLECAKPSFVIDLRIVPRFDVGRLNRDRAFDIFDAIGTQYIDLTSILVIGSSTKDTVVRFRDFMATTNFDLSRPVVFLLSRRETSVATDSEILDALAASGKQATEVMQVPLYKTVERANYH